MYIRTIGFIGSTLKHHLFPEPSEDNEEYRVALLLRTVCISAIIVLLILTIVWSFVMEPTVFRVALTHVIIIVALALSVLYAVHKQRLHAARMMAALGTYGVALVGVWLYGGVDTPLFSSVLPLCILIAGFLSTPRWAFVVSGISIAIGPPLIWLERSGYITNVIPRADSDLYNYSLTIPALCLIPIVNYFAEHSFRTLMRKYQESESARHKNEITELKNAQLSAEIREQQRVGEALRAAKDAAEQGERAKGQFLATMSHEIRTPMNAVIGMTNLLLESDVDDEVRSTLKIIQNSSESLLTIINDILDYSKIDHGGMELDEQPVNLLDCINSALVSVSYQAQSKHLPINIHIDDEAPATILTDGGRLRQILVNLLANAVKFTEAGHINLRVSWMPAAEDTPASSTGELNGFHRSAQDSERNRILQFEVQDTGIGISDANLEKLFRPFSQADASHTRRFGGSGLGLTISMRLAELMGGKMWVKSVEGEGSQFFFTIRTCPTEMVAHEDVSTTNASVYLGVSHPLSILLVEDNRVNQKVALMMLEKLGYAADVANNGLEALQHLSVKQYDLVFMDIHMPEMDGLQATSEIKRRLPTAELPRIVAMTASAMEEDKIQAFAMGMNAFLGKPVRKPELVAILESTRCLSGLMDCEDNSQASHRHTAQQPQDETSEEATALISEQ